MIAYVSSVVVATAIVALGGFIAYSEDGGVSRTLRSALSLLLLYTVAAPVVTLVVDLGDVSIDYIIDYDSPPDVDDPEYYRVAEEAFCDGICRLVCDEYLLNGADVTVRAFDFDFKSMSARKIKIILKGSAAYADARGITATVTDAGLGECEVEIDLS